MNKPKIPRRVKDRTGVVYGWLTALEYAGINAKGVHMWLCRCKCGKEKMLRGIALKSVKSCGCARESNLTGKRFGRLLAVKQTEDRAHRSIVWECLCDCGKRFFALSNSLVSGNTSSCGCGGNQLYPDRADALYNLLYSGVKHLHKKKGGDLVDLISLEQFTKLAKQNCTYCGAPPSRKVADYLTGMVVEVNGIDRINSDELYKHTNCVACCTMCNKAKLNHDLPHFKEWIERVYTHISKKKL